MHEGPGKRWEASKFVLLGVHFICYFSKEIVKPGTSSRTRGRMSRAIWRMKCTQSSTNFEASQSFSVPSCILIAASKEMAMYNDKLAPETEPRSVTFFST